MVSLKRGFSVQNYGMSCGLDAIVRRVRCRKSSMADPKSRSFRRGSLLNETDQLIFRAATGSGQRALDAFRSWRAKLLIDDLPQTALSAMPLLLELIKRHSIEDPQLGRMRGMGRHIWVSNTLQLDHLFQALDAVASGGETAVLMKGAALYARDPASATKRRSSDYDILVEAEAIGAVASALAVAGFSPKHLTWADFDPSLPESATAGVPIRKDGFHSEIDLHWRPLPNIFDAALTRRIIAAAEPASLLGRRVLIPIPAHHLFLALARCAPSESTESFARLLEGYFLMTSSGASVDWDELIHLVRYYGLQSVALSYLSTIATECELPVPSDVLRQLESSQTSSSSREWAFRCIPPAELSPMQNRALVSWDVQFHRAQPGTSPPGVIEALLTYGLMVGAVRPAVRVMWEFARRRLHGESTGKPRFLQGFSYPEIEGRWTNARYAAVALPLTEAQKKGQPVRLKAHLFCPKGRIASVAATAGKGTIRRKIRRAGEPLDIAIRCKSLPSLGGDALILLWLPNAISPLDAEESADPRMLGLYLYREWQR